MQNNLKVCIYIFLSVQILVVLTSKMCSFLKKTTLFAQISTTCLKLGNECGVTYVVELYRTQNLLGFLEIFIYLLFIIFILCA